MDLNNGTNTTQELFCYGTQASILVVNPKILMALMVVNTFISITATIGNLLVLVTIWRSPNLHSPSNTLLFGLALSDLCVGIVSEPLHVGFQAVLFNDSSKITSCTLTKVRNLISVFLTVVTLLTVTAMSVDRYLAIYLHLRYEQVVTEKTTRKVLLCLWLISSLPLVMMAFDTMAMTSYLVMALIIAVCLAIISFSWIKIYQVVRHHQAQIQDQMAVASQSFNMARFRNSAVNTMLVLVVVLVCYTPFLVSKIFLTVDLNPSSVLFVEITYVFVLLNSSLNPFVYFWRQRDLRAQAKQLAMTFRCQTQ
ncbi:melanocortin receptor 4-like [Orbicella faveolata]|uniref:melanocortin receptor 4-like n=1 Tax=Orbicella faveolata TaxID=48498 RepID=UPI0009E479CF|nr:melanocortin receptor 4-like [Orbicella faveolata]